ncbi:cytochrome P450 [Streptomyces sp. NBC_00247]|uniref:cytochrome P450 n=1 Tax=Streptomyces sp. NBC_00247 TaxID=2975689 RepID=UPI002E2BBF83|nr:cytochrome P450 [Streptomyces sp. NBC_00247]
MSGPGAHAPAASGPADTVRRILDPASRPHPYALYDEVRAVEPVWMDGEHPVVVFASHAACASVLRDPRASNDRRHALMYGYRRDGAERGGGEGDDAAPRAELPSFLFADPPRHTTLRRLVAPDFTPQAARRLTPMIKDLIDDLIDDMAEQFESRSVVDGVGVLASPLPVTVICHVLGIDTGERGWYRTRSSLLGRAVDPYLAFVGTPAPGAAERQRAEAELTSFFTELAHARRVEPRDDVMSRLLAARPDGSPLSDTEVVTTCRLLLNAGHETTVNLIAGGLHVLLRHPETLAALRGTPSTAGPLVEELLRFEAPLQIVHRHAREDMEVLGTPIRRGTTMVLLLGGANRDAEVFSCPHSLRTERAETSRHLSFGLGAHYCLGAPLGRLEAELAFVRIAQRVVEPRPADEKPSFRPHVVLRGPETVPLRAAGVLGRDLPWGR